MSILAGETPFLYLRSAWVRCARGPSPPGPSAVFQDNSQSFVVYSALRVARRVTESRAGADESQVLDREVPLPGSRIYVTSARAWLFLNTF
jgi:hypothetical protein